MCRAQLRNTAASPELSEDPQGGPELSEDPQGGPELSEDPQGGPELSEDPQGGPELMAISEKSCGLKCSAKLRLESTPAQLGVVPHAAGGPAQRQACGCF
ncbi:hypothetical protein CYMTET_24582 [Cymbomonas tetramitiformis]|uniref:Uncharacterized protein n=1 Tax=Cymbomonas tetramitiformis TaxID=36881 RepID=A0AAE0L049_9CHLO|nr:hypothetical protein CYMTET_24582 [Cymbomonas tetramitiformis]